MSEEIKFYGSNLIKSKDELAGIPLIWDTLKNNSSHISDVTIPHVLILDREEALEKNHQSFNFVNGVQVSYTDLSGENNSVRFANTIWDFKDIITTPMDDSDSSSFPAYFALSSTNLGRSNSSVVLSPEGLFVKLNQRPVYLNVNVPNYWGAQVYGKEFVYVFSFECPDALNYESLAQAKLPSLDGIFPYSKEHFEGVPNLNILEAGEGSISSFRQGFLNYIDYAIESGVRPTLPNFTISNNSVKISQDPFIAKIQGFSLALNFGKIIYDNKISCASYDGSMEEIVSKFKSKSQEFSTGTMKYALSVVNALIERDIKLFADLISESDITLPNVIEPITTCCVLSNYLCENWSHVSSIISSGKYPSAKSNNPLEMDSKYHLNRKIDISHINNPRFRFMGEPNQIRLQTDGHLVRDIYELTHLSDGGVQTYNNGEHTSGNSEYTFCVNLLTDNEHLSELNYNIKSSAGTSAMYAPLILSEDKSLFISSEDHSPVFAVQDFLSHIGI